MQICLVDFDFQIVLIMCKSYVIMPRSCLFICMHLIMYYMKMLNIYMTETYMNEYVADCCNVYVTFISCQREVIGDINQTLLSANIRQKPK